MSREDIHSNLMDDSFSSDEAWELMEDVEGGSIVVWKINAYAEASKNA